MADQVEVVLKDGVSAPAKGAAAALADLDSKIKGVTAAASKSKGAMSDLEGSLKKISGVSRAGVFGATPKTAEELSRSVKRLSVFRDAANEMAEMGRQARANAKSTGFLARVLRPFDSPRLAAGLSRFGEELQALGPVIGGAGGTATRLSGSLIQMAASAGPAGIAIAAVAAAAVVAVGSLAALGVGVISLAKRFAALQIGFRSVFGDAAKGDKALKEIRILAAELGLEVEDTAKSFLKLKALGFEEGVATDIIKMSADLAALGAQGPQIASIQLAMGQIKTAGKLLGTELRQLTEAGVSTEFIFEALGKRLGVTAEKAKEMQRSGDILADDAIAAIFDAVNRKLQQDKVGDTARKLADSLVNAGGVIKAGFTNLLLDLGERAAPALTRALEKIDIKGFFKSEGFQKFAEVLGTAVESIASIIEGLAPAFRGFFDGLVEGFTAAAPLFQETFKAIASMTGQKDAMSGLATVFKAIGFVIGAVAAAIGGLIAAIQLVISAIGWLAGKIGEAITAVTGFKASLNISAAFNAITSQASALGGAIIQGISNGIKNGASAVIAAVTGVAGGAIAQAKAVLGIASPSRVFYDIGQFTAEGFALGVEASQPRVSSSLAATVDPTAFKGLGGSTTNNHYSAKPSANISVYGDSSGVAQQVKDVLLDEFAGALEQIMIEHAGAR